MTLPQETTSLYFIEENGKYDFITLFLSSAKRHHLFWKKC